MNGQHPSRNAAFTFTAPLYDTTGLTSVLANPYAQHMSPHYYQAYLQAYSNPRPRTTPDGYTLSSTYDPAAARQTRRATPTVSALPLPDQPARSPPTVKPIQNHLTFGSWYQPGNCRCTRPGCRFTGSGKSVEIHMMDRHLIFPSGWKMKQGDWDADPSLRGKPIAIQGTSLVLDTPEAIDVWIAERKKRFPTEEKVREKKRKLEEAVARGELTLDDMGIGTRKKRRQDATVVEGGRRGVRGKGRQTSRGRRREPLVQKGRAAEKLDDLLADAKVGRPQEPSPSPAPTADDDGAPEVVSSKVPTASPCIRKVDASHDREIKITLGHVPCPRRLPQPKKPLRNPFASRSMLLRNLLLPEIRITVSNLSQAIRFLVENDFFHGVELRPGEAQERMIEVVGSSETSCSAQLGTCEHGSEVV